MASGLVKVLGCGSSGGVPLATGYWGACDPANPKNVRKRASIAVTLGDACLIVDTGPDFRAQTIEYGLKKIDAVLYTHAHSDHVNGIDDLRYLKYAMQVDMIDAYGDMATISELQERFAHMFAASADGLYQPVIAPHVFHNDHYGQPQTIKGVTLTPIWQQHGVAGHSVGYRFGNFGYSTDISALDDAALTALTGIDTWLVDCAQLNTEYTHVHPNLPMIQDWNTRIGAKRVILTHLTPRLDYAAVMAELPKGYEVAYDGMDIEFQP